MKTIFLTIFFVVTLTSYSQEKNSITPHNEIKLNAFNLIVYQAIDVSYEYLKNENHSLGLSILFKINGVEPQDLPFRPEISTNRNFSITPYYRRYFSKKYVKGFFIEGFSMLASGKEFIGDSSLVIDENTIETVYTSSKYTVLRFGISLGVKMVSKNGFAVDIYFGIATNPIKNRNMKNDIEQVSRGGISMGYRF